MKAKAIPECYWEVEIHLIGKYFFASKTKDNCGLDTDLNEIVGNDFDTKRKARNSWIRFAKLNNIRYYKFVE